MRGSVGEDRRQARQGAGVGGMERHEVEEHRQTRQGGRYGGGGDYGGQYGGQMQQMGGRQRYGDIGHYGGSSTYWDEPWLDIERDLRNMGLVGYNRGADWGLFGPCIEHELAEEGSETGKYTMNVPLGCNINPEDIKVSCKEHCLTIEARKECKSNDGTSRLYQEFMRKFTLPEHVNMKEVKSILTPQGYLHIEAPLPKKTLLEGKQEKEIPIRT